MNIIEKISRLDEKQRETLLARIKADGDAKPVRSATFFTIVPDRISSCAWRSLAASICSESFLPVCIRYRRER